MVLKRTSGLDTTSLTFLLVAHLENFIDMNRRDLLVFGGVIAFALCGYSDISSLTTSYDIINHFVFWFVLICVYLVLMIIFSLLFTKFGKWGDKQLFKK